MLVQLLNLPTEISTGYIMIAGLNVCPVFRSLALVQVVRLELPTRSAVTNSLICVLIESEAAIVYCIVGLLYYCLVVARVVNATLKKYRRYRYRYRY